LTWPGFVEGLFFMNGSLVEFALENLSL
jgi:hypothetical protein